jgi:TPR repeat protein
MTKPARALLAAAALLAGQPAFGQATQGATDVAPVTVTAKRPPYRWVPAPNPVPAELFADSELCWQRAQDPYLEAQPHGGRIYLPTRLPRNPDWNAPPRSPPGSTLPAVRTIKDYIRGEPGQPGRKLALAGKFLECLGVYQNAPSLADQMDTMALELTLRVRAAASSGTITVGGAGGMGVLADGFGSSVNGRAEIRVRDKTMPLAFALFDEGRYEEALKQFKAADRKIGNREARLMIGKIYLYGLGEKSDPVEAVKWLKWTADVAFNPASDMPVFDPLEPERNTPVGEAAMILADLYGGGRGPVAKDPALARRYLARAYEVGHIPAAMTLGDIHYYGVDTPVDRKTALDWYMKAAQFAHAPAAVAVAQMYDAGEVDGGPDHTKALAWYAQAANINHPQALYALALAFDRGQGVPANPQSALAFYKLAATQGEPAAQTAIGTYFYTGEGGLPHDAALARKWFELAATAGDPDGMFNLAAMMAKGEGGALDRVKAWGWLKIAERAGHANAGAAASALEAQLSPQEQAGVAELKRTG